MARSVLSVTSADRVGEGGTVGRCASARVGYARFVTFRHKVTVSLR